MTGRAVCLAAVVFLAEAVMTGPRVVMAQDGGIPSVRAGNDNVDVKLSGRVHRMIQIVADGRETAAFLTDSDQGPTMLRVDAATKQSGDLTIGGAIELGTQHNSPFQVNQENRDAGVRISGRFFELTLTSERLGKLSFGRGFMASWLALEVDLSGTLIASLLPVGHLFGGLRFNNARTNQLTNIRVLDQFADLERLLIKDRVRYDSPSLAGFKLSGSYATDDRWDTALRFRPKVENFVVSLGSSYQQKPFGDVDWRFDIGGGIRHEATGLNVSGGFSRQEFQGGRQSDSFVVKVGWLASLVPLGKTAFSADYARNKDIRATEDDGTSVGVFVVQDWDPYGFKFYAGSRVYDITYPGFETDRLWVFPVGAIFTF